MKKKGPPRQPLFRSIRIVRHRTWRLPLPLCAARRRLRRARRPLGGFLPSPGGLPCVLDQDDDRVRRGYELGRLGHFRS
jgi:hypothetical protein